MSLSPGIIATPQGAHEFRHTPLKQELYALTPLEREGTMIEIADAVEFLLSDRASFISGVDLLVDGGLNAAIRNRREAEVSTDPVAQTPSPTSAAGDVVDDAPLVAVRSVSHVGLTVSDLDRSVAFYTRVLGFRVVSGSKWEEGRGSRCTSISWPSSCSAPFPMRRGRRPTR